MGGEPRDISRLVEGVLANYQERKIMIKVEDANQINKKVIIDILYKLRSLVFPGFFTDKPLKLDYLEYYVGELLEDVHYNLQKQIYKALKAKESERTNLAEEAALVTQTFLERLPAVRDLLATDVVAAFEGDPAAYNYDEI
ncbi:MAG: serine acetyltransferase, partial [Deltaproteobacteria bacterium]|nr:serine acetyltransferase [Deltaproteobacteria bacterium]